MKQEGINQKDWNSDNRRSRRSCSDLLEASEREPLIAPEFQQERTLIVVGERGKFGADGRVGGAGQACWWRKPRADRWRLECWCRGFIASSSPFSRTSWCLPLYQSAQAVCVLTKRLCLPVHSNSFHSHLLSLKCMTVETLKIAGFNESSKWGKCKGLLFCRRFQRLGCGNFC